MSAEEMGVDASASDSVRRWAGVRSRWETGSHKEDHLLGFVGAYKRRLEGPPTRTPQVGELVLGRVTDLGVGVDSAIVAESRREDVGL